VLDVNVLLYDPNALRAFPNADVIIPISAIEEIDQFKSEMSETGRNARLVSKTIDQFRQTGSLSKGVAQDNGSTIRVHVWTGGETHFPREFDIRKSGNRVLAAAMQLRDQDGGRVILVSQDTNVRIKANALGLEAISYEGGHPHPTEIYTGYKVENVPKAELARLYGLESLTPEGKFNPNEGMIFQDEEDDSTGVVFRYDAKSGLLRPVLAQDEVWSLKPRNPQQVLALDLLQDPRLSIITLMGKAGTGKTLLALAAGLRMMLDESLYSKLLVSRPIFPMGKDIGYLPGTAEEKLEPWMQPIFDNLEFLIGSPVSQRHPAKGYQALMDQGLINIEPLTYIRGRSIPNQFMIVDEAQNLTPHEIKTIITRVGEGTKIILTGDAYQIDNPYVDSLSNGLSHVAERLKDMPIAGHVTLSRGERSTLAETAANLL